MPPSSLQLSSPVSEEEPQIRDITGIDQSHTASKWQSWDSKSILSDFKPALTLYCDWLATVEERRFHEVTSASPSC